MTQSHLRSEIYVKMLKKKKKRCSTYHPYITSDNWKDTCTPTFTAALFTITKVQKQAQCCLTDEWMNKKEYISIHWIILPWKWVKSQYMSHHGRALRALGWKIIQNTHILYDSICMKQQTWKRKGDRVLPGAGRRGKWDVTEFLLGVMKMF